MPTLEPMKGPGQFQWNRGGWFGSQLGGTAWLLVGAASLAARAPVVASSWLACFAVANAAGSWLWSRRDRIRPYEALQGLLLMVGLCGLTAIATLDVLGPEVAGPAGRLSGGYLALLIVPTLMAWFAILESIARRSSRSRDQAPSGR